MPPGLLGIRRPYVEIKVNQKRKFIEVEDSNNDCGDHEGNHNDDDEDAYMASRLNGLNTFIAMFETAFEALKKEVAEIDSYIVNKRRCRNH